MLAVLLATAAGYAIGVFAKPIQPNRKIESSKETQVEAQTLATHAPPPATETLSGAQCIERLAEWIKSPDGLAQQFPLYDAIAKIPPSAFREVALAASKRNVSAIREAREVLILRWRMVDPEGLLRFHHDFKESYPVTTYLSIDFIIERLATTDLAHTLALLRELESNGEELIAEYRALYRVVRDLPSTPATQEAIAFARNGAARLGSDLEPKPRRAANLPAPTVTNILSELETNSHNAILLFNKLAASDIDTALELALSIEKADTKRRFLGVALNAYGSEYPHESIWLIPEFYNLNDHNSARQIERLLSAALSTDPSAAKTWAQEPESKAIVTRFLKKTHSIRPEYLPFLEELEDSRWKEERINQAVRALGHTDFQAAQEWIASHMAPEEALAAQAGLITQQFEHDRQEAIDLLDKLPSGQTRDTAISQLSRHWGQKNFDEALEWAKAQTDPKDQAAAFQPLAQFWVSKDFEAAQDFATQNLDPKTADSFERAIYQHLQQFESPQAGLLYLANSREESGRNHLTQQAFTRYAATDPRGAIELAQAHPTFQGASSIAATHWAQADPDAATEYFLERGGKIAEDGLPAVVQSYAQFAPEQLIELSQKIADPNLRQTFYQTVRSDPALNQYNPKIYQQLLTELEL